MQMSKFSDLWGRKFRIKSIGQRSKIGKGEKGQNIGKGDDDEEGNWTGRRMIKKILLMLWPIFCRSRDIFGYIHNHDFASMNLGGLENCWSVSDIRTDHKNWLNFDRIWGRRSTDRTLKLILFLPLSCVRSLARARFDQNIARKNPSTDRTELVLWTDWSEEKEERNAIRSVWIAAALISQIQLALSVRSASKIPLARACANSSGKSWKFWGNSSNFCPLLSSNSILTLFYPLNPIDPDVITPNPTGFN